MTASQQLSQVAYEQASASAAGDDGGVNESPNDDEVVDAEIVDDDQADR
jgi:hypothetical protein